MTNAHDPYAAFAEKIALLQELLSRADAELASYAIGAQRADEELARAERRLRAAMSLLRWVEAWQRAITVPGEIVRAAEALRREMEQ